MKEIKVNLKDRISIEDKVTLQMKDEDWGGVFEKDEVSCSFGRIVCME